MKEEKKGRKTFVVKKKYIWKIKLKSQQFVEIKLKPANYFLGFAARSQDKFLLLSRKKSLWDKIASQVQNKFVHFRFRLLSSDVQINFIFFPVISHLSRKFTHKRLKFPFPFEHFSSPLNHNLKWIEFEWWLLL